MTQWGGNEICRVPYRRGASELITIQVIMQHNPMIDEDIVVPRLVNTQVVDFNDWCKRLAYGSTVTAADVAAVMKQIENKLPEILSLNAKVICSPNGLTFRPKVSGSLTKSQLKAKLEAKKNALQETDPEKAALIDVDRSLKTSDLTVRDCSVSIVVDLPKSWSEEFQRNATLKRVNKSLVEEEEGGEDTGSSTEDTQSGGGVPGPGSGNGGE